MSRVDRDDRECGGESKVAHQGLGGLVPTTGRRKITGGPGPEGGRQRRDGRSGTTTEQVASCQTWTVVRCQSALRRYRSVGRTGLPTLHSSGRASPSVTLPTRHSHSHSPLSLSLSLPLPITRPPATPPSARRSAPVSSARCRRACTPPS